MGNSCVTVHRPTKTPSGFRGNAEDVLIKRRKPYKTKYDYGEEKVIGGVCKSRPKLEILSEQEHEGEEVRYKIDGLNDSDLAAFQGLRRKDVIRFLERSLSEKENTYTRGIRRIERKTNRMSRTAAQPDLCVHIVTWNMNGRVACHELHKLVGGRGESFDLYVIGLQEVPNCDANSVILNALGKNYSLVAASVMVSLQLFVFARKVLLPYIEDVRMDKVGIGGLGGVVRRHKGAVAVALKYKGSSFLFIACHLSPHENNVLERNVQYQRICQTIFNKPRPSHLRSPTHITDLSGCRTPDFQTVNSSLHSLLPSLAVGRSDVVVWLGDLNYRIEGSRKSVGFLINQNLQKLLRAKDQLSREAEKGEIFHGYCEGPLSFKPTYKYDIGTDDYDTSAKERIPSWTDRILYKVNAGTNMKANVQDYDSIETIKTSDHRPVKALLTIHLDSFSHRRKN